MFELERREVERRIGERGELFKMNLFMLHDEIVVFSCCCVISAIHAAADCFIWLSESQ